MPKQVPTPDVEYAQVEEPDTKAVEAAFDLLFEMVLAANNAEVVYPTEAEQ